MGLCSKENYVTIHRGEGIVREYEKTQKESVRITEEWSEDTDIYTLHTHL